jgi:hypothetical protein
MMLVSRTRCSKARVNVLTALRCIRGTSAPHSNRSSRCGISGMSAGGIG